MLVVLNFMKKSPYAIEHLRDKLASEKKLQKLKKTYSLKYLEIKDSNSAPFWNVKWSIYNGLQQQDSITKDRIRTTASFLPKTAKRILDIGIGHGWVEELIENRDVELYGNDISDQAIKDVKRRFQGKFLTQSLYNLKYKKNFFDTIFLLEVLEHVPPSMTFKVLSDIRNILKSQGYFILSVPTNEGLEHMFGNPNGHVRMYTIPLISAELQLAGFKVIKLKTLYAFNKYYIFKKMIAKYLWKNHWHPNNIIILAQKI